MNNLKCIRESRNISRSELAAKLLVTQQAVAKWENGEAYPRAQLLPKLAILLECTIDDLFNRAS